jgi:2-phosphosulfolactate phosphatase
MKVDVALSVNDIKQDEIQKKTVIVIDSLRATSTILTALYQGSKRVIPVETVGQALQYNGHENTVLIGERYCKKVNGFELGNSPLELSTIDLSGKTVVITSTNGTKAMQKVKKASHILVGSFLNMTHCIQQALSYKKDIVIICAGRRGQFAIEDGLTAGMMIHYLRQNKAEIEISDISLMLENDYHSKQDLLLQIIEQGATAKRLIQTAQEDDLHFCLQLDLYSITGVYEEGGIVQLISKG